MVLIITVAPSRTGKFPASVARLITAPRPVMENVWPAEFEIFGDDAGVPRAAGGGDEAGDQIRKNRRQEQLAPALHAAQVEYVADFLEIRGDRAGARDHIEQDVPLRSQQQQNNGRDAQSSAGANQQQQHDGEQRGRGHGCGHLRDRLCEGGQPRLQSDVDTHRDGPQRGQHQGEFDAQETLRLRRTKISCSSVREMRVSIALIFAIA